MSPRLAGLGIAVQGDDFVPAGLREFPPAPTLPELGQIEFVLTSPERPFAARTVHFRPPFSTTPIGDRAASL
jgi:hypothetical protein